MMFMRAVLITLCVCLAAAEVDAAPHDRTKDHRSIGTRKRDPAGRYRRAQTMRVSGPVTNIFTGHKDEGGFYTAYRVPKGVKLDIELMGRTLPSDVKSALEKDRGFTSGSAGNLKTSALSDLQASRLIKTLSPSAKSGLIEDFVKSTGSLPVGQSKTLHIQ